MIEPDVPLSAPKPGRHRHGDPGGAPGGVVLVGMGGEEIPLPLAHVQTREPR